MIKRFEQYQMPKITLSEETPKEAVCIVFEKVNTGGVSLTVFELMTATFAADDYNLRDDWQKRRTSLRDFKVLESVTSDDLLQAVALLATYQRRQDWLATGATAENAPGVSCKRKGHSAPDAGRIPALGRRRHRRFQKGRQPALQPEDLQRGDLPYRTQLVPLCRCLRRVERCSRQRRRAYTAYPLVLVRCAG